MTSEGTASATAAPRGYEALLAIDVSVLEAIPAAVYLCAADGVIVRFNRRATELWGRAPEAGDTDARFCGSFRLYQPDGTFLPHASISANLPERFKQSPQLAKPHDPAALLKKVRAAVSRAD